MEYRNYNGMFPYDVREHTNQAEPDQSLTIQEILRNVATTGVTGLPRPVSAVYDDEDNIDFDDPVIQPEFDNLDALDALESHRRNARSLKKRIDVEKKHQKELDEQKRLQDAQELEQLRQAQKVQQSKTIKNEGGN